MKSPVVTIGLTLAMAPAFTAAQTLEHSGKGWMIIGSAVEHLDESHKFISNALVAGAPFTADAVTEFIQILSDGNRIERRYSAALARDGRGRTRREQEVALLGPLAPLQDESPRLVTISDPVAGTHYTLDTMRKVARRESPVFTKVIQNVLEAHKLTAKLNAHAAQDVIVTRTKQNAQLIAGHVLSDHGEPASKVVTEKLGTRRIEGVEAEGVRSTMTIPEGAIGNVLPIDVVTERWFSNELHEAVLITRRDPRSGDTVYRLANIVRSEPPPDLFVVPPEYQVEDLTKLKKLHALDNKIEAGKAGKN